MRQFVFHRLADDTMFAIITFRATGPIKSWSDIRGANVHNARTKPIEHAMPGAPKPEHLVGTGDLVADVKLHLRMAGIDPAKLRKHGVIAYEAIMTASPDFFDAGDKVARAARLRTWTDAQIAFARKRWGDHRVASMVLHLDEKTPHIHVVVVPLELKVDGRRKGDGERNSLVGRLISGPGQFDQLQDDYAAAMVPFGLVRGVKGSGRKNEPVAVYLRRLAEKECEADELRVALIRERDGVAAERADLARVRAEMGRDHQRVLDAAREAGRRNHAAHVAQIEAERLLRDRAPWTKERDAAEADLAARQASFARYRDNLVDARERLVPIYAAAMEFETAAAGLTAKDIAPRVLPAVVAAREVMEITRAVRSPALAQQRAMIAQAAGRC